MSTTDAKLSSLDLMTLLGPPPLLEGEDEKIYGELWRRVLHVIEPSDALGDIWVRDFVDHTWEGIRWRRLGTSLMRACAHLGLERILQRFLDDDLSPEDMAKSWAARDPNTLKQVEQILASAGLTMDAVMAETLSLKLNEMERIHRMAGLAEARRDAILREVGRHRETLSQKLRRTVEQLEDRHIRAIESTSIDGTNSK